MLNRTPMGILHPTTPWWALLLTVGVFGLAIFGLTKRLGTR